MKYQTLFSGDNKKSSCRLLKFYLACQVLKSLKLLLYFCDKRDLIFIVLGLSKFYSHIF